MSELRKLPIHAKIEPIENIHLTLKFLGNTDENKIELIHQKLNEISNKYIEFITEIKGYGFFPNVRNPRIFWLGIQDINEQIMQLQKDIEESMNLLGYEKERREFKSHFTLARIKSNKNINKLVEKIGLLSEIRYEPLRIKYFILYESNLKPEGAEYHILKKYYLKEVNS